MSLRWWVGFATLLSLGCGSGPPRAACDPQPAAGTLGAVCGFSHPEDLEVVPSAGVLLVSQMRPLVGAGDGGIVAATLESLRAPPAVIWPLWPPAAGLTPASSQGGAIVGDPSCTTPPVPERFAPHGISTRVLGGGDVVRVAVVGHGPREAIELFDLRGRGRTAVLTWRGCVPLPPQMAANDLAIAADGSLVVANCLPSFGGVRGVVSMIGANLGVSTGDVIQWSAARGWRHLEDTVARMANGIAVAPADGALFFSETGAGQVGRISGGRVTRASVPGRPDNLSWSSRGTLLAATHLANLDFARCAVGRTPCRSAWALLEIDPQTLTAKTLLEHEGDVVGAVAGAAEFDGRYYLSAVFDDRIGVWQPAEPGAEP
jgi:hypothetical protein